MKFCIIFTNNDNEEYTLKYKVYNTPIAVKWYESLCKQVLNKDNKVKESDRLYNFPDDEWNEEKIVSELNKCIETINSKTKVIMHTAFVGMPQEQLNHLHHYFEELRGASKNSADYYLNASPNERLALERYNVIIHRAENFYLENTINTSKVSPRIVVTFKGRKKELLADNDYEYFTLHRKFGEVYINYCEVGKPLYDVYKDNDDIVGEDNIRPLKWYSPDFTAYFFNRPIETVENFLQGMDLWWDQNNNYLTALGFTKGDPKNAIGNIPVAMLESSLTSKEIVLAISEYNNIDRVEIYD
jgi:hypothetical protein